VTVANAGNAPAERIRVQAGLDGGLEAAGRTSLVDELVPTLGVGQSKTISVPVSATRPGRLGIQVTATAERGGAAVPQTASVDVKDVQLALTAHGPVRGYVGQEITWQLVVRNNGDVGMSNVVVRARLPAEVSFTKATDGGKVSGRDVVWDLGSAPARQERAVAVTGVCKNPAARAAMAASVSATPVGEGDGARRPAAGIKPLAPRTAEAAVEIVGIPALQMAVKDSEDPVGVGRRTNYTVRIKNAGTAVARGVRLSAEVPRGTLRPTRATGPGAAGKIAEQREPEAYTVAFPPLDSLGPNAEATFVIEAEGLVPGEVRVRFEVSSASQANALHAEETTRVIRAESRPQDR
jgi:uncharacterized repeat protein (TIGR01451 family)